MELTLTTPALLFPAISLLLLAYTNRFLALAGLVRGIHSKYVINKEEALEGQIWNLKKRLWIIKQMQILGTISFFLCVFTMLVLFFKSMLVGAIIFTLSLIFLLISLCFSIWELRISVDALDIQLSDCQE